MDDKETSWERLNDNELRLHNAKGDKLAFHYRASTGEIAIMTGRKLFVVALQVLEDFVLDQKGWEEIQPKFLPATEESP